ncbi:DNA-3-methyladenine glycosylase family protein [Brevibacillus sp. TJ4]|uniref:DNA-3-methyladenine glycosylase family protein n=1 Tax=Brevibacillus sp. TJ4 TaxID=3234853 RepID=UPI0037CFAB3B
MDTLLRFTRQSESVIALGEADAQLNKLIHVIGELELTVRHNHFYSLAMSVIGQQLSAKAASTIRKRVSLLCPEFSPEHVLQIPVEQLREAGVSRPKIAYIHDLCGRIQSKELDFGGIHQLNNEQVIQMLTAVKGIGTWTAEMFLIFSLGRTDVLSLADVGLQRAARWLYDTPDALAQHGPRWNPYASVASLYLWESIDRGLVDSGASIDELYQSASQ